MEHNEKREFGEQATPHLDIDALLDIHPDFDLVPSDSDELEDGTGNYSLFSEVDKDKSNDKGEDSREKTGKSETVQEQDHHDNVSMSLDDADVTRMMEEEEEEEEEEGGVEEVKGEEAGEERVGGQMDEDLVALEDEEGEEDLLLLLQEEGGDESEEEEVGDIS